MIFRAKKLAGSKLTIIIAALLVLILLLFIFRGWVRATVIPRTVSVFYVHKVQATMDSEMAKLQDPFKSLGYKNAKKTPARCSRGIAQGFRTEVTCTASIEAYSEISQLSIDTKTLNSNINKLMQLLKQNGWQGEYSNNSQYSSLAKTVGGVASGIDYYPDATYMKTKNKVVCILDSFTAFSKPKPPAISTNLLCSRTLDILGKPDANLRGLD